MDQSVPGFVPGGFLSDDAVGLFRADERVFEAMLDRWSAQMLARGLQVDTIKARCGVVRRFQAYSGKFRGPGSPSTSTTTWASAGRVRSRSV